MAIETFTTYLAVGQLHEGAILDALETVEQSLEVNGDILAHRPETLRVRGELRFKQGQTELAEGDFREAVALARIIELARSGRPIQELAREFEPSANAIRKWVKQPGLDEGLRSGRRSPRGL